MQINRRYIDKESIDKERLVDLISKFSSVKVLVCGDLILDEYLSGYPSRISREAPVIILKYQNSEFALGGSANAANNIASLGAKVKLIGCLGRDNNAEVFKRLCHEANIELEVLIDDNKPTTTKTRVISSSNSNPDAGTGLKQQVLRIDKEFSEDISDQMSNDLNMIFSKNLHDIDVALLSDYENGNLTVENSKSLVNACKEKNIKSIIDSTGDLKKFRGAYSFTPNQPDLEKYTQDSIFSDDDLVNKAQAVKTELDTEKLLITRGAKGMTLVSDREADFIPALNLSEVFDVTGAGDTVAATYSIALAAGATALEAAILGNLAASLVVKKYGTATSSQKELLELIDKLA